MFKIAFIMYACYCKQFNDFMLQQIKSIIVIILLLWMRMMDVNMKDIDEF